MNLPPEVREKRLRDALRSLVSTLVPVQDIEDDDLADELQSNALELAKDLLASGIAPAVVADVNHASDLIKKKLMRSNPTPEKAFRFTNLYSRLLSLPGIRQKWAFLYFLYQLSESGQQNDLSSSTNVEGTTRMFANGESSSSGGMFQQLPSTTSTIKDNVIAEAFATDGLKQRPTPDEGQVKPRWLDSGSRTDTVRREVPEVKDTTYQKPQHDTFEPSEAALLRDLPFTLQGLSSTNFKFTSTTTLKLPSTLPPPLISILYTLAEPSLLYRGLSAFVKSSEGGLVGQSLRAAIGGELRSYLGLVATLEGQIRRALASLDENEPRDGIGKAGVTLKRCVVWTREATMGLRLMSLIAEESRSKRGGQLISLIHGFSSTHGDPMVGAFAERLLKDVTRPFYDMLRQWIYDGELSDPFQEFFVIEQSAEAIQAAQDGKGRGGASSVWEDKYRLAADMVPSIITGDFAQKIFLIGKSLNFIRYGCGDALWVEEYAKGASKELRYGDTATLEAWIDEAYKTTMARLIHLMADKFRLFEHLQALKDYILLGQGDFIALLMESLAANLDRPAGAQYRHTLTAQLEHAIRGSNAQYDAAEVLRRLDARMLHFSHGDIGWDCFTLEYKIDAPVDVVVTEWGSRQYLKVFNLLWRVKRVEFVLATTWRKCMTGARGVLRGVAAPVAQAWRLTRGVVAEMIHFVGQLQYYILFEVIESSWDELQTAIRRDGCTLDDLIGAHTRYLNAITHKGLLGARTARHKTAAAGAGAGGTEAEDGAGGSSSGGSNPFMAQLGDLLRLMLSYRDAVDGLYSWSVSDFTRRQEASVRAETRQGARRNAGASANANVDDDTLSSGGGGGTPAPGALPALLLDLASATDEDDVFPALQERLKDLGTRFKAKLNVLLGDLAYQPDVDMRFLGVVMNFNDVYKPVRRSKVRKT